MNPVKKSLQYFHEVFEEMKKVTWPSREATTRYAIMVVVVSVMVGVFFAALDFVFNLGLQKLLTL